MADAAMGSAFCIEGAAVLTVVVHRAHEPIGYHGTDHQNPGEGDETDECLNHGFNAV